MPAHGLDAQGVRELLAGVALELGDERAKTAMALQERDQYARYAAGMQQSATVLPWLTGAGGVVLGGIIASVAAWLAVQAHLHTVAP